MSDKKEATVHVFSKFATVATHPTLSIQPFFVAPTVATEFNALGLDLKPVGCVGLSEALFDFDSSFVRPDILSVMKEIPPLREKHKNAKGELPPLSIFGHADPVGDDNYNKQLSGRRAKAIFGLLTRSPKVWNELIDKPFMGDDWKGRNAIKTMSEFTGSPKGTPRQKLIEAYMAAICPFELTKQDFLARGADGQGKGDFQGCSEFNPLVILSTEEEKTLEKEERDEENRTNRRVVIFLFPGGSKVNPTRWPCPHAEGPTAACRLRFFVTPVKGDERRKAGPERREFKKTRDTFACRFYDGFAHESPCEAPIVALKPLRVHLKLMYLDPEGKLRVFPPDFPVTVEFSKGDTREEKVGKNGRISFDVAREKSKFTLRFDSAGAQFIGAATENTKDSRPDRLIPEGELKSAIDDHYRVFKLPQRWGLADSDWKAQGNDAGRFIDNAFRKLEDETVTVGFDNAPVDLILDPHWQSMRFVYFDRKRKLVLSIPPIMVDGFLKASASKGAPDTQSNWTVAEDTARQCLPWILRKPPKPDKDVLLRFETESDTFIETLEDKTRRLVSGVKHDTPSADRLRFYDLPKLWKSSAYFARFRGLLLAEGDDVFEKVADKPTTLLKPVTFSLDDIVLTDAVAHPIAWKPDDRAAIFKYTFSNVSKDENGVESTEFDISELGLHLPDRGGDESFLTKKPKFETTRNYIADYPNWTRLVVAQGNLFDVFDKRTVSGPVIGARAAVRWFDSPPKAAPGVDLDPRPQAIEKPAASFFTIQPFYHQRHDDSSNQRVDADDSIGRYDLALLRCCDAENGVEIACAFQYFRYHFNFSPAPDSSFVSKPLGANAPPKKNKAEQRKFANTTISGMTTRWNSLDEHGIDRVQLLPVEPDKNKVRAKMIWFAQSLPRAISHMSIGVFKSVRANMGSVDGLGSMEVDDSVPAADGDFGMAHETGHIGSLGDEYIERSISASYDHSGIISYSPGSPFSFDTDAMMKDNIDLRPRYNWQLAEWLHALPRVGFPFFVKQGKFDFRLPHHAAFPRQSFVNFPLAHAFKTSTDGNGQYDVFLYPLGDEPYNTEVLASMLKDLGKDPGGKIDGMLVILVKMKLSFFKNDHKLITDTLDQLTDGVHTNLNMTWFAKGTAKAKAPTGDVSLKNVFIRFSPRFLVENFSGDKSIKDDMNVKNAQEYAAKVSELESTHGIDCRIKVVKTGASKWEVKPDAPGAGKKAPQGRLVLSSAESLDMTFPPFFWNMLGLSTAVTAKDDGFVTNMNAGALELTKIVRQVIPDAEVGVYK